jgi:hypothetical protein
MTLAEAADIFEEFKALEARAKVAREKLIGHFRKTGGTNYKGRIGYSTGTQKRLDQKAVKEYLGDQLPKFQKDVPTESVYPLG